MSWVSRRIKKRYRRWSRLSMEGVVAEPVGYIVHILILMMSSNQQQLSDGNSPVCTSSNEMVFD